MRTSGAKRTFVTAIIGVALLAAACAPEPPAPPPPPTTQPPPAFQLPAAPVGASAAPLAAMDAPDPFVLSVDPQYCVPAPPTTTTTTSTSTTTTSTSTTTEPPSTTTSTTTTSTTTSPTTTTTQPAALPDACYLAYTTQVYLLVTPLWRSTDLVHWEIADDLNGSAVAQVAPWVQYGRNWAPSVLDRPANDPSQRYVMWYSAHEKATDLQCLGVATAASPLGPFVDTSTKPAYCQPGGTIDANPFVDTDGTAYLVYKSESPAKIFVSRLAADGRSLVAGTEHFLWQGPGIADSPVVEGPNLVKVGGRIYLFYSTGDWRTAQYRVGVAQCDAVTGPCFAKYSSAVLASRGSMLGPGGQTPFQDTTGAWHLMFHAWTAPLVGYPTGARSLHLLPLTFTATDVIVG